MRVEHLCKAYDGKTVLQVERFTFSPNKIYAAIGANGSGKSTFARLLAGVLLPDAGAIWHESGETVGYLPQKSYPFAISVLRNVLLPVRNTAENRKRANALLQQMGISHLASQRADRLSGGETARMALCRVMMRECSFLILDEPTAAMDIEAAQLAEEAIRTYHKSVGGTILLITHSIRQAQRLADEVLFFRQGELWESGAAVRLLQSPQRPETRAFLDFFRD